MTVRLLVLVQEHAFADALASRLEAEPDLEIVAALYSTVPPSHLFTGSRADVILLDGDFPGNAAFQLCAALSQRGESPRVIILSYDSDPRHIVHGLEAGAVGWVGKDESLDRLIDVIHGVASGETWLPTGKTGKVLRLLLSRPEPEPNGRGELFAMLTQREREVLVCLADGAGRRDMAEHLNMSPNTVRTHLQNLMTKLGVHSALEAVALTRAHLNG
jgi:DNA-binding NarL/FixJ family response regulator